MAKTINLNIQGMTCASCVGRVERALKKNPRILSASVNLATEKATIEFQGLSPEEIIQIVSSAGYEASLERKPEEDRSPPWFLILSAFCTLPLILGMHQGLPPFVQLALATPVQFIFGFSFYRQAYFALKNRSGNMELLVALGTSAAYFLSLYLLAEDQTELYFESSATVITLILFGKYLEKRAKKKTTEALSALEKLRPSSARVLTPSGESEVPLEAVRIGDIVLVKSGERIPLDGSIIRGTTEVDESLITGESALIPKVIGAKVIGGSVNGSGLIEVKVTATGSKTFLSHVIRLVEDAQSKKAPIQKLVDKVSAHFVPVVLLISGMTLLITGLATSDWEEALIHSVSVLVIACPCALGLATPVTILVGTGVAAKRGILIRDAEVLEVLHRVDLVAFDKTGTLTQGKPEVQSLISFESTEEDFLRLLAGIQAGSDHPLAKAVLAKAQGHGIKFERTPDHRSIPGTGVEASVAGKTYTLGNKKILEGVLHQEIIRKHESWGETVSVLTSGETVVGIVTFSDVTRPQSKPTIDYLHGLGIQSLVLSGDNQGSVDRVAKELGIDEALGELSPAEKEQIISAKRDLHTVAMVGDGINDSPALASAHVGIAMASGTDAAMQTAGLTLMHGDPSLIPVAIDLSRATYKKIKQNLFWAFAYNVVGIPLAALGYLSPMVAGLAMALSSVCVVVNALMLRTWKP